MHRFPTRLDSRRRSKEAHDRAENALQLEPHQLAHKAAQTPPAVGFFSTTGLNPVPTAVVRPPVRRVHGGADTCRAPGSGNLATLSGGFDRAAATATAADTAAAAAAAAAAAVAIVAVVRTSRLLPRSSPSEHHQPAPSTPSPVVRRPCQQQAGALDLLSQAILVLRAVNGGGVQQVGGGPAALVRGPLVCPPPQEEVDGHLQARALPEAGLVEGRLSVRVGHVHGGPAPQQGVHGVALAVIGAVEQGRPAEVRLGLDVRPGLDEGVDGAHPVGPSRLEAHTK